MINSLLKKIGYKIVSKYLYRLDFYSLNLITYWTRMYEKVKGLDGEIVECGVGKGRSFMVLNFLAKGGKVTGFDSFQGFPEPSEEDESFRNSKRGEWGGVSRKAVFKSLEVAYVKDNDSKLIEGFFENTIPHYEGKIRLLHLDCDLYQSYKTCLKYLYPKVVKGGVVLFDDYGFDEWPGATQAVNEYGLKPIKDESGKYYVIKN